MNGGRTSSRLLRTDDIRRYLERKEFKSKARRWSVCSDESDSSAVSDSSLRSLPQYSSYRALSAQGSLTSMSQISSPTSSLHTPSKLKQPSVTRKALSKDGHDSGIPTVSSPVPGILSVSRENSFTKGGAKASGIPTPNMSRENSFTKIAKMKRESSLPSIKRETSKTSLKEGKRQDLSSSEILKREKAPAKKEPPPVRPRQGAIPATGGPSQINSTSVSTFAIGDRVEIMGSQKKGVIQFIGETKFAKGSWAGIVLDESCGKNDGSVGGVRYFQCAPNYGVFVKVDKLKKDSGLPAPLKGRVKGEAAVPSGATKEVVVNQSKVESVSNLDTLDLKPGDRVTIGENRVGTVRYLGNAGFAKGIWCGVELDEPHGKNDGAVAGTRYFECQPKYGLFSPVHKVKRLQSEPEIKQEETSELKQEPSVSNEENKPLPLVKQKSEEVLDHVQAPAMQEPSPVVSAKPEPSPVVSTEVLEAHKQLVSNLQDTIARLEKEKSETELLVEEEKRKCEDLQFQLEEQLLIGAEASKEDNEEKLSELQETVGLKDQELHQLMEEVKKTQLSEESYKETITKLEMSLQDYQRRETSINSNAESDRTKLHQLEDLLQSKDKELEEISFLSKEEIFIKEEEIKQLTEQYDEQCKLFTIAKEETAQLQIELCSRKEKETEEARKYEELKRTFDEQNDVITTLRKELSELKQEHSGCACKIEALESRIEHMRSEKQSLEKEMKSTIQASGDFSEQLEKLSDQVMQKSRELTDMNTEVSVLKKEKAALQARLEEYKGLESSKNEEIEKIKTELSSRDKQLSKLEGEVKQTNSRLTEVLSLQSESSQATVELQQKLAASKEELSSVNKAKKAAEENCTAVTRQLDALKSDYSDLLEKLRLSEDESQVCRTEVEHLKLNMNEGSGKVDQLHRDMNVMKSELQAAHEKLAGARDDCRAMEIKYTSACAERDRVNDELEKKIFEYDQLKVETEVMVEEEKNISERERTRCEALDNDRLNLQNKVEQTLRQLQTKEGDLASAKSQIQELERQLMSEKSQRMKLEESVSSGSTSHGTNNVKANGEGDKDKEIEFLNSVIVDVQKKNEELEAKLVVFESEGLVTSETLGLEPSDFNQSGLRPELRPRLFCDICDVFDEHDTEDCPQQSSEADAGSKHHGIRGEERPFCTICEMFGHEAINCEDDLMF